MSLLVSPPGAPLRNPPFPFALGRGALPLVSIVGMYGSVSEVVDEGAIILRVEDSLMMN